LKKSSLTAKETISTDIIRVVAISLVILVHAATEPTLLQQQLSTVDITQWWIANIYNSLARIGVPLFVLSSGALLLNPSKVEPMRTFFKKRFVRVGLPLLFWSIVSATSVVITFSALRGITSFAVLFLLSSSDKRSHHTT
jgi:surface polysaccharide O-acyltransferase-like enzyme